ncbi:MAG: hypothetical protein ABH871_09985 [Pseudomonadota bacterium]
MADNEIKITSSMTPPIPAKGAADATANSQETEDKVVIKAEMIPYAYVAHYEMPDGVGVNGPGATVGFEYFPASEDGFSVGLGVQASIIPLGGELRLKGAVTEHSDCVDGYTCQSGETVDKVTTESQDIKARSSGLMWNFAAMLRFKAPIGEYFHVSGGSGIGGTHLYLDEPAKIDSFSLAGLVNADMGVGNETAQAIAGINIMLVLADKSAVAAYPTIGGRISF